MRRMLPTNIDGFQAYAGLGRASCERERDQAQRARIGSIRIELQHLGEEVPDVSGPQLATCGSTTDDVLEDQWAKVASEEYGTVVTKNLLHLVMRSAQQWCKVL
jgi:hypothetical protein